MGSCLVEVAHIGIEDVLKLLLLIDQQVIEAFLPHAPHEAFADRIGSWGMIGRFQYLDAAGCGHVRETGPKFAIVISYQILWSLSIGVASRSCWATQASVGERVTPTWMTLRVLSSMRKKAKS